FRYLHLTPEQVSEIYAKFYGSPSFPHLVVSMSVAPVLALSLSANNVIPKWRQVIGTDGSLREDWFYPISMRSRYGLQKTKANMLHGSETLKDANRENRYFYPDSILEPLPAELQKVTDYCDIYVNPTLINGLTEVVKNKPIDPVLFLADWLLMNNPFQPRLPYSIAITPT
ncbi:PREDICTED: nucleoside diphosphate kinase homolog 5-like, partial [Nicrophorus vespilloides]|uniref:Nucleoside diphosphate kinase homolog 5-like n=1 Tax=Nicrophorus vespilloides TaxID=110193 RepID=A0ABM1N1J3_NICVS